MNNYDAYLFDWDGTLARTVELWLEEIYKQYGVYGLTITQAENARMFGNLKAPLQYGLPRHQLSEFQEGVNRAVKARLPDVSLYDDAFQVLAALKGQGKRLALVTSTLRPLLDTVLGNHNVAHLFDTIVTSEDVTTHKPDPEGILMAVGRLGADKTKTIMLGDTTMDLLAAHNAGIDSALFYPKAHQQLYALPDLQAHEPTYTIKAWRELLHQLQ